MKSPAVKRLGLADKKLSEEELLEWMTREPRLIRRPIIVFGGRVLFGFKPGEVEEALRGAP